MDLFLICKNKKLCKLINLKLKFSELKHNNLEENLDSIRHPHKINKKQKTQKETINPKITSIIKFNNIKKSLSR